ncbi:MAG TPA: gephyrin-like molybdotransferase Glp [Homoserinimonas sp.]|nr:gephyrin-like molybdotransferase Glp [Homoserinimonas sp.]
MVGAAEHTQQSISVDEHFSRVLGALEPLAPALTPLAQALGRTLAMDTVAQVDVPGFDNSAMDGYAVRRADVLAAGEDAPVTLQVVGDVAAGSASNPSILPGQAARIMTGAPLPDDADCVVPVEHTDAGTASVLISRAPEPSAHIRRVGTDIRLGELVLPAGRTLRATDLAAAAAAGLPGLVVHPAPRVGVLSTGDELRGPGESLARGQIHDSNSLLLAAAVTEAGGIPVQLGAIPDDNELLHQTFARHAADVDAFVTSGGVSVGAYDVVKAVLAPLGVWFGPVRMQPGKPQGFGRWLDGTPIFTLPGNPVSVFVSFEAFVRPALLTLQGRLEVRRPLARATANIGWRSTQGRAQYMPAVVHETATGLQVQPASSGGSGSYLVASLANANALAIIREDATEVLEGETVDVLVFGDIVFGKKAASDTLREP